MLRKGYTSQPCVIAPWNAGTPAFKEWDVDRTLSVLHVYATLAIFYAAAQLRGPSLEHGFGNLKGDTLTGFRKSLDRARFLSGALKNHIAQLGYAGRSFVNWISNLLIEMEGGRLPLQDSPHLKPQKPSAEFPLSFDL